MALRSTGWKGTEEKDGRETWASGGLLLRRSRVRWTRDLYLLSLLLSSSFSCIKRPTRFRYSWKSGDDDLHLPLPEIFRVGNSKHWLKKQGPLSRFETRTRIVFERKIFRNQKPYSSPNFYSLFPFSFDQKKKNFVLFNGTPSPFFFVRHETGCETGERRDNRKSGGKKWKSQGAHVSSRGFFFNLPLPRSRATCLGHTL